MHDCLQECQRANEGEDHRRDECRNEYSVGGSRIIGHMYHPLCILWEEYNRNIAEHGRNDCRRQIDKDEESEIPPGSIPGICEKANGSAHVSRLIE